MKKCNLKKVIVFFILTCAFVLAVPSMHASAATKAQINKKISTLNTQIKKLKAQKKSAEATEKKQKKGTIAVCGRIVSYNPLVVKNLFGEYLYITDDKYLNNLISMCTGYVKKTGGTTVFYQGVSAYTCTVCKSVYVSDKSLSIKKKLDKKRKALKIYKEALKDAYVMPKTLEVEVGAEGYMDGDWKYSGKYNSLKWTSSNKKIASITSKGYLNALKPGTVTISAKASISGKVTKCKVKIVKPEKPEETENQEPDIPENTESEKIESGVVNVLSSLVISMEQTYGYLNITATEDNTSGHDAFSKGDDGETIATDYISYAIADGCIWEVQQVYQEEGTTEKIDTTFYDIQQYVEEDRQRYLDDGSLAAYYMELEIEESEIVRVTYTYIVNQ